MSQQKDDNRKEENAAEESKKSITNPGEDFQAENNSKMQAEPEEDTSVPKNKNSAESEEDPNHLEDAMVNEAASGEATSNQKSREKTNPEDDPYQDLEDEDGNAENPFFKEPEVLKDKKDAQEDKQHQEDSTDHEDAIVSEATSAKDKKKIEEEDDDLDSDLGSAVVDESKKIKKSHQEDMDDAVAEDSEDEATTQRHDIEKKDYHSMTKEQLTDELEKLLKNEKIQAIKEHVAEIRSEFNAKFDEDLEEKKEEFLAEGGNIIDFHYSTPLQKRFNTEYFNYREQRNNYYRRLKKDLNENLNRRLELIEELKGLLGVEENINTTYNYFKDIQDKWKTAGPIPRDKYNTVWNTYHHHVENFYDFLHLNREFRDMDFKYNLEQKLKVINRAEELSQENDINRAFRELQMLHKMWKEELGPVEKQYRDDIWERFSKATKDLHDKRQDYYNNLEDHYEKNWETKRQIIEKINEIAENKYDSHSKWQQNIKKIETLRDEFFKAGKVPRAKNQETWDAFKGNVRKFNRNKNAYYKGLKKDQYDNLEKKKELIQIAQDHKDSDDFKTVTPLMKKVQTDWKKIGHVPRKDSDKIWKEFKAACNHYFDRLHSQKNEENKEEMEAFDAKKDVLDSLKAMELTGEKKEDLAKIKEKIHAWKEIGRVPYNKRFIEGKFNKSLDQFFNKMDLDNTKAEMLKYENKINALDEADDEKKIRNEHYFLSKKVEETKAEIRQLENNLQFFSNVNDDNPLVKDVHKNIANHKADLEVWEEKLRKVKTLY